MHLRIPLAAGFRVTVAPTVRSTHAHRGFHHTSMKIVFMSRNGHDKNMTKMYRNGLMFWVKEWTFKPRNGLFCFNDLM